MKNKIKKLLSLLRKPIPIIIEVWMVPFVFALVIAETMSLMTDQPVWTQLVFSVFCILGSVWWVLYMHDRHGYVKAINEMDFQRRNKKKQSSE